MSLRPQLALSRCSHGRPALQRTHALLRSNPIVPGKPRQPRSISSLGYVSGHGRRYTTSETIAPTSSFAPFRHQQRAGSRAGKIVNEQPLTADAESSEFIAFIDEASPSSNSENDRPMEDLPKEAHGSAVYEGGLQFIGKEDTYESDLDVSIPQGDKLPTTAWRFDIAKPVDIETYPYRPVKHDFDNNAHQAFVQKILSDFAASHPNADCSTSNISTKDNDAWQNWDSNLTHSPEKVLFVLANTRFPKHDLRIRMHCLAYLDMNCKDKIEGSPTFRKSFYEEVKKCKDPLEWPAAYFPSFYLDLMLRRSTVEEGHLIVQTVLDIYPFSQPGIYNTIVRWYIHLGDIAGCLQFLSKLPREYFVDRSIRIRDTLAYLLRFDTIVASDTGSNFLILPQLLKLGLELDGKMYNVVLKNAIKQDLHGVAWDMYHYLRDSHDYHLHATSYAILLRDAFIRRLPQVMEEVMTDIHESEALSRTPCLIVYSMNIVRVISFHQGMTSPTDAWARMLGLYDRAWNRQALEPFRVLDGTEPPARELDVGQPPPRYLAFTLWSYILVQRSERTVNALWGRITRLIEQGDEVASEPFRHDIVYNGLILFYARKLDTLIQALKVFEHMISHELCEPTPMTWSLMVCGFLRHHQVDQAVGIMRMMKARGLELSYISEEHMPHDYSHAELESIIEAELDETRIPAAVEVWNPSPPDEDEEAPLKAQSEAEVMKDLAELNKLVV